MRQRNWRTTNIDTHLPAFPFFALQWPRELDLDSLEKLLAGRPFKSNLKFRFHTGRWSMANRSASSPKSRLRAGCVTKVSFIPTFSLPLKASCRRWRIHITALVHFPFDIRFSSHFLDLLCAQSRVCDRRSGAKSEMRVRAFEKWAWPQHLFWGGKEIAEK